jgi:iron complex outermembrane recepter protein
MRRSKVAPALAVLMACTICLVNLAVAADAGPAKARVNEAAKPDTLVYMNPFEILVTASRIPLPLKQVPAATTVVGGEQLRTMPRGVSIDEALRTVPGVRIDDQMGAERIHLSIRGQGILTEAGVRGTKVLLDGLPLNDPSGVAPDIYDVDWSVVRRVEVLRGPSGALYGGGGSAGVINIATNDGEPGPLHGGAATTFGSHNFNKTTANFGGTRGYANYQVSFSRASADGYRQHTAFFARNLYEKVRWDPTSSVHLTQVIGWTDYFDQNAEGLSIGQVRQDPRQPNPDANVYNEYYLTNRFFSGITGQVEINRHHDLQCAGYFRTTRAAVSVPRNVDHRSYLTPGLSLQYNLHTPLAQVGDADVLNHFSLGSDVQWQTFDEYKLAHPSGSAREDTLQANQKVGQRGIGIFVMDRLELGSQWGLVLGGRYDDMRNKLKDQFASDPVDVSGKASFHKGTARAGLAYTPLAELNLYGNWSQGFLPPSTEELSGNPDAFGGFNRHLAPATSQGEEIGVRGTLRDVFSYDVTGFHLKTDKDFDRYRIADRRLETFYRNVGASKRYGVETQVRFHPIASLKSEIAYTYSHFRYTSPDALKDKILPNIPTHQLTIDLEHEPLPGVTLGVTCEVQTKWQINSQNTAGGVDTGGNSFDAPPVNGFTLWGARASYAWKLAGVRGELTIAGKNIFGRKYIAFSEPDPDGNSYQPGPRQEVFGGVSVHL